MATTELNALNKTQAYQLANITKTPPQFGAITPRWLTRFLEFKGLDAGIYRVNKVAEGETPLDVLRSSEKKSPQIPEGYVEYQQKPREYTLNSISTIFQETKAGDARAAYSPVVAPYTGMPSKGKHYKNEPSPAAGFDVNRVRQDFPILSEKVSGGKPLVWLDNGATTQKPNAVIDRISYFYRHENSNVHRGAHELAARSTDVYEAARETIAKFLALHRKTISCLCGEQRKALTLRRRVM